jgi:hypothetical protein
MDLSVPEPSHMGRSEYWLKTKDTYIGYSWNYFMYEK